MTDSHILAYLAGVIDSDGSIGIKRSTYAMRHGNGGQATYSERVMCRQVTPEAVRLLNDYVRVLSTHDKLSDAPRLCVPLQ